MRASSLIMRFTGTLLLAAAVLKATGLGLDTVGRMGVLSLPEVQLAVILFEISLGLWLWSGYHPVASWSVAVLTFTIFAGVTFYLGMVGQTSCGCFGKFSPSPWYAFGLDVFVLALLAVGRPDLKSAWQNPRATFAASFLPLAGGILGVALFAGLLSAAAHLAFGSLPAAIAYFRGERVTVTPRMVDVGEGPQGERRKGTIELTNWTDKSIRLIGGTADCSCTVLDDLPLIIPAMESRAVLVEMALTGKPGIFTRQATFLVEGDVSQSVSFGLTGRITDRIE